MSDFVTRTAGPADRALESYAMRLACAETFSGNVRVANLITLPGLESWVHSAPASAGDVGGDVHYVSLCSSCIVSRIALADVSGHGRAVTAVAHTLRDLMQRHLHALEQVGLMRDLNDAVRNEMDAVHYATMVAVGWHSRRGLMVMTNAGHPPPLWFRAAQHNWSWLETSRLGRRERPSGTPLGVLAGIDYDRRVIRPEAGDLIVLYSDGASESADPNGNELGRDGLASIARGLDAGSAETFGAQLVSALDEFRGHEECPDDQTIVVLRRINA